MSSIGEQAKVARRLSFSTPPRTPERKQLMQSPKAQIAVTPDGSPSTLADPFKTPPPPSVPTSVSMERSPPSPYRALCLPCAERARTFYERAHGDHVANELFAKYMNLDGLPTPPSPVVLTGAGERAFNRFIGSTAKPDVTQATPKAPGAYPEDTSWPDPYDGAM